MACKSCLFHDIYIYIIKYLNHSFVKCLDYFIVFHFYTKNCHTHILTDKHPSEITESTVIHISMAFDIFCQISLQKGCFNLNVTVYNHAWSLLLTINIFHIFANDR